MEYLGGTNARMLRNPDLLDAILPAVRSDYVATETYRYRGAPRLDCPVTAFIGDSDPRVDIPMAEAWADHTTDGFRLHVYTGGTSFWSPISKPWRRRWRSPFPPFKHCRHRINNSVF